MKTMKRITALLLAAIMVMAMAITSFAAELMVTGVTVTVTNADKQSSGMMVYAYKLLSATDGTTEGVYQYTLSDDSTINTALKDVLGIVVEDVSSLTAEQVYNKISEKTSPAAMKVFADDFVKKMGNDWQTKAKYTASISTNNTTATFDDMEGGYYLFYVPNVNAAVCTLTGSTDDESKKITLKSELPTVDKSSDKGTSTNHDGVNVGETVTFEVRTAIPNTSAYTGGYTFTLTDTLSEGLDFVKNNNQKVEVSLEIEDNGTAITGVSLPSVEGTVDTSNSRKMTVELGTTVSGETAQQHVGKTLVISYSATVNANAVVDTHNNAEITYSNNPGTEDTGKTVPDTEYVPTYELKIKKVGSDSTTAALAGATFQLKDSSGNAIEVVGSNGVYTVYAEDTTPEGAATITDMVTVASFTAECNLRINGLKKGTYILEEIVAPSGYNKVAPITVTITGGTEPEGVTPTFDVTTDDVSGVDVNDSNVITIVNIKGSGLPSTGGIGTVIFTAVGVVLIAGVGASFLFGKKKKAN